MARKKKSLIKKEDIVRKLSAKSSLPLRDCRDIYDMFIDILKEELLQENSILIQGLMKLEIIKKKSTIVPSPGSKELFNKIPSRYIIKPKISTIFRKTFRDRKNNRS